MKKNNQKIIPIMFCFDKNYVIPASVAFYSLLEHADKTYYYKFYVLNSDISKEQQKKLKETLKEFEKNYDITYIDMKNKFEDVWENLKSKVHFSKEVLYKLLMSSIFPQYDKMIVTDVDVVFLDDISKSYFAFEPNEDYYVAGVKSIGVLKQFNTVYDGKFSPEMVKKLSNVCGGYLVFNLKKIREDNMEEKFVKFLKENVDNLIYLEQDVINACCYGKIKYLPLSYVTCTYMWTLYGSKEEMERDETYSYKELTYAMNHPIQLHYASTEKPWKYVDCVKSEVWFSYIVKTAFLRDFLEQLPHMIVLPTKDANSSNGENNNSNVVKPSKIKRILKYIKNNPFFFLKKEFYQKLINKIKWKLRRK